MIGRDIFIAGAALTLVVWSYVSTPFYLAPFLFAAAVFAASIVKILYNMSK